MSNIGYKLNGKSFTLATASTPYLLSTEVPLLFTGYDATQLNSGYGFTAVYVESADPFGIELQDETSGIFTDVYSATTAFNLSDICVNDIRITPSTNGQAFYVFVSGR